MTEEPAASLTAVVARLADEGAITRVLHDYCDHVDANRSDAIVALFTDDAVFDFGYGRIFTGASELSQLFLALAGYDATSHHLSNIVIDFTGPDVAECRSHVYAFHRRADTGATMHLWGRYSDTLVRRRDDDPTSPRWAIRQRPQRAAAEAGTEPGAGVPGRWEPIPRVGRELPATVRHEMTR
jgi:ketosteroid isomerase-like protein